MITKRDLLEHFSGVAYEHGWEECWADIEKTTEKLVDAYINKAITLNQLNKKMSVYIEEAFIEAHERHKYQHFFDFMGDYLTEVWHEDKIEVLQDEMIFRK